MRQLARTAGLEDPTPEQLARFDRKRKKGTSNRDWKHPYNPDARVAKMKDGRTRMAHKAEHAVDLASGAITGVTLQPADRGDTTSVAETLEVTQRTLKSAGGLRVSEAVLDKGYHSDDVLEQFAEQGTRSYIAEPERGRRSWQGPDGKRRQQRLYDNRRRERGARARNLHRLRCELTERSFAHTYDTGGMRRTHLRGHRNILKRRLIHVAAFDISLVMRKRYGSGKPKGTTARDSRPSGAVGDRLTALSRIYWALYAASRIRAAGKAIRSLFRRAAYRSAQLIVIVPQA